WDKGSFYDRLTNISAFGVEANADQIGMVAAGTVAAGLAVHAGVTAVRKLTGRDSHPPHG
ncbi:uptake hydrogenase small subunit, partial [Rhodoplanes sp. SY1]